jgi:ABC-2 type transport system ATP-binding protein
MDESDSGGAEQGTPGEGAPIDEHAPAEPPRVSAPPTRPPPPELDAEADTEKEVSPEPATEPMAAAPAMPATIPHAPAARVSAPPAAAILEVKDLKKSYGRVVALSGLDLSVRAGEVYGFLGRNGAGKSTTIRILMGITEASSGTIRLFDEPLGRDLVKARRRIGYVAQEQSFYGWMSPRDLARFVRAFYPSWDDAEHARLVRRLDLPMDRKIGTFSGGMRVKTALATALAHRPPLLLLDEPTAGLDPVARREFLEIVRSESQSSGCTTFFSSHLIDEVELVAHRVGIVDEGRMRFEGSVRRLGERVRLVTRALHGESGPETARDWLVQNGFRVLRTEVHASEGERTARYFVESEDSTRLDLLAADAGLGFTVSHLPLEEIFIAMVRKDQPDAPRAPAHA